MQSASWCFTLNNPDASLCDGNIPEWDLQRYRIYQYEKAPETGTLHIQGYVHFEKKRTLRQVRSLLPTAHWERAKGTAEQNRKYCSKEDTRVIGPFESGSIPNPGKRTDLHKCVEDIKTGKSLHDLDGVCVVKFFKGLVNYQQLFVPDRTEMPTVYWFWGKTATGKSEAARDIGLGEQYWKPPGKWWDGYQNEPVVVIDDLRAEDYPFQFLLRLFDRYPLRLEFKGGYVKFNSKTIIVTAPCRPEYMFQDRHGDDDVQQLVRRITEIKEFIKTR